MKKALISTVIAAAVSTAAYAEIVGEQTTRASEDYRIEVKASTVNFGPHHSGKAGIGVSNSLFGIGSAVDFEGMANSTSKKITHRNVKGTTVHTFKNPIPQEGNHWYQIHKDLGNFNFIKVGSGDLWVGEWAKNSTDGKNIRQVYYVGDNAGTTMPSGGTATYKTYGLNNFDGSNLMKGTLNVNFKDKKLKGSLSNNSKTLVLKDVSIDAATASFSGANGAAKMSGQDGTVSGRFFGAQAAALAGVAKFEGRTDLNTSFGGTKQ